MHTNTSRRWHLIGAAVAVTVAATACGSGDDHLSSPGRMSDVAGETTPLTALVAAPCPTIENADRLSVALALVDELISTEGVFGGAEPASPAQFRSREVADDIRHRLDTLLHPRCLRP